MDYTTTLTDTQVKGLEYAAKDPKEWIANAAQARASIAIAEIIEKNTAHCNTNSIAIAVGEDAQVTQAFTVGAVKTAAQVEKERKDP